ncbi:MULTISPECIES: hypothetical protein [unclassified Streptosporangium]|uniref:hypothetical protein n=1 Tax=unclassified Streptosporangium TaxID=2632669 RepID=UPI002E2E2DFD|nr:MULTISPECIES: hypothetical protein [unclassified Streptosporangium]
MSDGLFELMESLAAPGAGPVLPAVPVIADAGSIERCEGLRRHACRPSYRR